MYKQFVFFVVCILLLFTACKKDHLQFVHVEKLQTYTTTDRFNKILFVNDTLAFVAGGLRFYRGTLLSTRDGGYTWRNDTFTTAQKELFSITTSPSGSIYAIGFDGKLLISNDMGQTWNFKQLFFLTITDISFINNEKAIIAGGISFNSGCQMYIDADGNIIKKDSLTYQLNRVTMVNTQLGYCCGSGLVVRTKDGANTWTPLDIKDDDFTGMYIQPGHIWLCGYNGGIYHSGDEGDTWQKYRNGNDVTAIHYKLLDIVFKDSQHGWAVGENGVVIYSDDGGHHWMEYDHFTSNTLRSIALCPNGNLLVCGDNGDLFRLSVQ